MQQPEALTGLAKGSKTDRGILMPHPHRPFLPPNMVDGWITKIWKAPLPYLSPPPSPPPHVVEWLVPLLHTMMVLSNHISTETVVMMRTHSDSTTHTMPEKKYALKTASIHTVRHSGGLSEMNMSEHLH